MSGLLIRELMLRGDVARCLIVAPGSLVEQWQDELWDKFGVSFELMSRSAVDASRTGNPFLEKSLLIARIDQLSRAEDLIEKLKLADWDLVIVDETHKMSAHLYGDELRKTKRFELGEVLRDRTRHFLLLSATPHNGKNEDFLAFMTLIDPERFAGRLRDDEMPKTDDVMRRLVKENLRTFEGRRLFPQRFAKSLNFELSDPEQELYEAVTEYVRNGMDRANRMQEEGDRRRGIIFGFALAALQRRLASSPAAIYHSLRRRRDRLTDQAAELRRLTAATSRMTLGSLVCSVTYRHPAVLASAAVTCDHISNGRFVLGVGAGWQENEHQAYGFELGDPKTRSDRLEDSCRAIRGLLEAESWTMKAEHYELKDATHFPKPVQGRLPLLVGGKGERRTLRTAAMYADWWNAWVDAEALRHKRAVLGQHCDEVGRDPDEVSCSTQAFLCLSQDPEVQRNFVGRAGRRPILMGSIEAVADQVGQLHQAGAEELIIPDWTYDSLSRRDDELDQFISDVAPIFVD